MLPGIALPAPPSRHTQDWCASSRSPAAGVLLLLLLLDVAPGCRAKERIEQDYQERGLPTEAPETEGSSQQQQSGGGEGER